MFVAATLAAATYYQAASLKAQGTIAFDDPNRLLSSKRRLWGAAIPPLLEGLCCRTPFDANREP